MIDILWFRTLDEIAKAYYLSRTEIILLLAIITANKEKSFAMYRELCEFTNFHRSTVYALGYDLAGKGFITIEQPRRTLYYYPTPAGRQILYSMSARYKANRKAFDKADYFKKIAKKPQSFYA